VNFLASSSSLQSLMWYVSYSLAYAYVKVEANLKIDCGVRAAPLEGRCVVSFVKTAWNKICGKYSYLS
jgi:hypothetical protein